MEGMQDIEYDKTKYFLDQNRNKKYVQKGGSHKGKAYSLINDMGLSELYHHVYEEKISACEFILCCGYVLVDEAQETYKQTWDSSELVTFKAVGYCSAAINEDYIEYLKTTYEGEENVIDDCYDTDIHGKNLIDEVIKKVETIRKEREKWKERQLTGDERE